MTTSPENSSASVNLASSLSPAVIAAGRVAMILSLIGAVMLCMGDPVWLALPLSLVGVLLGGYAMRQDRGHRAGSNIGVCVGVVTVTLWLIALLVLGGDVRSINPTERVLTDIRQTR